MHLIQEKLLKLSNKENLAQLSLREMAKRIGMPNESPQKIKHHVLQLQKKGFLTIDKIKGAMVKTALKPSWSRGFLKDATKLFSIPIVGTANCGPAEIFAEQNFEGFLRVSGKLLGRSRPDGLFAIKTDGSSMNRANINGKHIENGDFVIVDSNETSPKNNEVVLAIIDEKATIKRFINDRINGQIVLKADSSFDYEPIYLHPKDNFFVNGKIIDIIKKPS